jgi:AcrR family transcriptional regulator
MTGAELEPDHLLPKRPPRLRAVQQRAVETIDVVIDETVKVIETEGENAVRIASISAATGVSYGAIYHHFHDRDGLIQAAQFARLRSQPELFTEPLADSFDRIEAGQGDGNDLIESIRAVCRAIVDPDRQNVRLVRISVLAAAQTRPELHDAVVDLHRPVMLEVRELVARAQAMGLAARDLDPLAVTTFLEAVAFGVVLQEYFGEQPDPEALVDVLFRSFVALVQPGS